MHDDLYSRLENERGKGMWRYLEGEVRNSENN